MAPLGHRIARQVGWAFSRLQYLAGATAVVLLVVAAAQQPVSEFDIVPTPERRLNVCLDGCLTGPVNPDLAYPDPAVSHAEREVPQTRRLSLGVPGGLADHALSRRIPRGGRPGVRAVPDVGSQAYRPPDQSPTNGAPSP